MIDQSSSPAQLALTYTFGDWCYWSEAQRQFTPLPGWATYLMSVGKAIEELPTTSQPTLTALSLPTARFAAVLTVSGYLLGSDETIPLEQHIGTLRNLAVGHQVWVNTSSKRIKGSFEGIVETDDGERVRVFVKQGKNSHYITVSLSSAGQIQIAANNTPTKRSRHIEKVQRTPFASFALRSAGNPRPWMQSSIEAAIVGQKNRLKEEITELPFSIETNRTHTSGFIQEVIRVREFAERGDPLGFATLVETPSEERPPDSDIPGLVVFDGPRAFLRSRSRYPQARHWIIILDRTSRDFSDAAMAIDDLYLERAGEIPSGKLPDPPTGIEVTSFKRGG